MQGRSKRTAITRKGHRVPTTRPSVGCAVDAGSVVLVTVVVRPKEAIPTNVAPFAPMTRDEFLKRHGARAGDLRTVAAFARSRRISVFRIDPVRRAVLLRGPFPLLQKTFGVVPKKLAGIVVAVLGLHPGSRRGKRSKPEGPVVTDAANGHGPKVRRGRLSTPRALERFYAFPSTSGKGQCIGIIELGGGYRKRDVRAYFESLGVKPHVGDVLVETPAKGKNVQEDPSVLEGFAAWMNGSGPCNHYIRSFFEVAMDVSIVGALAPDATIKVYFGGDDTLPALLCMIQEALFCANPQPSVLSISWGFQERAILADESDLAAAYQIDEAFLSAAHMGVTICCSAGDWGASNQIYDGFPGTGYDVEFPASSPYALACGGTTISAGGKEVVWNADFPPKPKKKEWGKHGATGGGYSAICARPPWQRALARSGSRAKRRGRAMPDVAAVADPRCGLRFEVAGCSVPSGGTSAAAPIWAALIARINEALGVRVGCLNAFLYANAGAHPKIVNDVTSGDNRFTKNDVGFEAGRGWDPCTGWGTPNGKALLELLRTLVASDRGEAQSRPGRKARRRV